MLCENCKKNQATTYFKTVINGEAREMHFCNECAKKFGGLNFFPNGFGLDGILSGLLGQYIPAQKPQTERLSCPVCGSTLDDFSESGRVGCANCYDAFYQSLMPYIRKIHGGATHVGRIPARIMISPKRRILALESELAQAITLQEYERAALIRDELKAIKAGDEK